MRCLQQRSIALDTGRQGATLVGVDARSVATDALRRNNNKGCEVSGCYFLTSLTLPTPSVREIQAWPTTPFVTILAHTGQPPPVVELFSCAKLLAQVACSWQGLCAALV